MRVGIDCLDIDPGYAGGVNSFTKGLLKGFAANVDEHTFRLYVSKANQRWFETVGSQPGFTCMVLHHENRLWKKWICGAALLTGSSDSYGGISDLVHGRAGKLMDKECDVIYTPTVALRYFSAQKPTVLSMHDLQHVHYPEFFSYAQRLSRNMRYGASARHADYFQASSRYIKADLLAHFPHLGREQIEVIPEAVQTTVFSVKQPGFETIRKRYGLAERFLFYPAQLWPHKNHLRLLKALHWIETTAGRRIPLVLTGAGYAAVRVIRKFMLEKSMTEVRYLGVVPFADLVSLYQNAAFLVMASLHESSSLPVLEAAAAGIPIAASRIPAIEEMAEHFNLNLFDPTNAEDMGRMILDLWDNPDQGRVQVITNRGQVAKYSWEKIAKDYLKLLERAVRN